jgi:hypothetical protein
VQTQDTGPVQREQSEGVRANREGIIENTEDNLVKILEAASKTQLNKRLSAFAAVFDQYDVLPDGKSKERLIHLSLDSLAQLGQPSNKGAYTFKQMGSALDKLVDLTSKLEPEYRESLTKRIGECRAILVQEGSSPYASRLVDSADRTERVLVGTDREFAPEMRNIRASKRMTATRQFNLEQMRKRKRDDVDDSGTAEN